MEEKRADDRRIEKKRELNAIDEMISDEKRKIHNMDEMEYNFISIKKNIDTTAELLSKSIKGGNINRVLDSVTANTGKIVSGALTNVDNDREVSKNKIRYLSDKKEELTDNN